MTATKADSTIPYRRFLRRLSALKITPKEGSNHTKWRHLPTNKWFIIPRHPADNVTFLVRKSAKKRLGLTKEEFNTLFGTDKKAASKATKQFLRRGDKIHTRLNEW